MASNDSKTKLKPRKAMGAQPEEMTSPGIERELAQSENLGRAVVEHLKRMGHAESVTMEIARKGEVFEVTLSAHRKRKNGLNSGNARMS